MKSFFKALSVASPKAAADDAATAAANGELLGKAEALLRKLRTGDGEDFPLLNEATRIGEKELLILLSVRCERCTQTPAPSCFFKSLEASHAMCPA